MLPNHTGNFRDTAPAVSASKTQTLAIETMENRFAGAQNQAERRRRRLSKEDSADSLQEADFPFAEITDRPVSGPPIQDALFRRLLSPRLWKSVAIILGSTLLVAVVIWQSREQANVFTSVTSTTGLSNRLAGLLLLVSGQLAVLIGWIRSTSHVDFKGRYRGWKWMGLMLCSVGAVLVLQVGGLIPDLVTAAVEPFTGPIRAAQPAILFALGATGSVIVLARILPDMGRCHSAQAILTIGILTTLVKTMLIHGSTAQVSQATLDALTLVASNCAFASMLLHCRYVAFVNNDPPVVSNRAAESKQGSRHDQQAVQDLTETSDAKPKAKVEPKNARPARKKKRTSRRKAA